MRTHLLECPETKIDCPEGCGMCRADILQLVYSFLRIAYVFFNLLKGAKLRRKNQTKHVQNICMEKSVLCTNDGCDTRMKRKCLQNHVSNECDLRIVACPYDKVGCTTEAMKACDLDQHLDQFQVEHLSMQFTAKLNETATRIREEADAENKRLLHELTTMRQQTVQQNAKLTQLSNKLDAVEQQLKDERKQSELQKHTLEQQLRQLTTKSNEHGKQEIHQVEYHTGTFSEQYHSDTVGRFHSKPIDYHHTGNLWWTHPGILYDGRWTCCKRRDPIGIGCQNMWRCCQQSRHSVGCEYVTGCCKRDGNSNGCKIGWKCCQQSRSAAGCKTRWTCCKQESQYASGCQSHTIPCIKYHPQAFEGASGWKCCNQSKSNAPGCSLMMFPFSNN